MWRNILGQIFDSKNGNWLSSFIVLVFLENLIFLAEDDNWKAKMKKRRSHRTDFDSKKTNIGQIFDFTANISLFLDRERERVLNPDRSCQSLVMQWCAPYQLADRLQACRVFTGMPWVIVCSCPDGQRCRVAHADQGPRRRAPSCSHPLELTWLCELHGSERTFRANAKWAVGPKLSFPSALAQLRHRNRGRRREFVREYSARRVHLKLLRRGCQRIVTGLNFLLSDCSRMDTSPTRKTALLEVIVLNYSMILEVPLPCASSPVTCLVIHKTRRAADILHHLAQCCSQKSFNRFRRFRWSQ